MKNRQRNCPRTEESKETQHCGILEFKKKKKKGEKTGEVQVKSRIYLVMYQCWHICFEIDFTSMQH